MIIVKFEKRFEDVSILHDHALHTGKPFINGHYFVILTLFVTMLQQRRSMTRIMYVSVPLGYQM